MAASEFESAVTAYLTSRGAVYRKFTHAKPAENLREAAAERGQTVEQIMRSILFRVAPTKAALGCGDYVLVLVPGEARVSWPVLRKYLKTPKLTMATADEVLRITGYRIGSVSPFGLPAELRLLVDETCFLPAEISTGSGVVGSTVIMSRDEMAKALPTHERGCFIE